MPLPASPRDRARAARALHALCRVISPIRLSRTLYIRLYTLYVFDILMYAFDIFKLLFHIYVFRYFMSLLAVVRALGASET